MITVGGIARGIVRRCDCRIHNVAKTANGTACQIIHTVGASKCTAASDVLRRIPDKEAVVCGDSSAIAIETTNPAGRGVPGKSTACGIYQIATIPVLDRSTAGICGFVVFKLSVHHPQHSGAGMSVEDGGTLIREVSLKNAIGEFERTCTIDAAICALHRDILHA